MVVINISGACQTLDATRANENILIISSFNNQ
jgi:hypothetical protein